jgi:phosphoribosylformimino-5-aminoimidazole carboxamide ribotide isomerase
LDLFPAIDLRQGVAVRLAQGDFARQQDYGDPLALADRFAKAGAHWVHVVDLDAARTGVPANRELLLAIAGRGDLAVQAGGGIRGADDVEQLLSGGVARVVLGTVAVEQPELVEELADRFPGRVAVALDHRGGGRELSLSGWERGSGVSVEEALARLSGLALAAVVVTAIEHDGVLSGPDIDGLRGVLGMLGPAGKGAPAVIASGGVRTADDLRRLGALELGGRQLSGVVVGRALAEGTLGVEEAIAACAASG